MARGRYQRSRGSPGFADDLTEHIDRVDLPGLLLELHPDCRAKPGREGDILATWRGEKNPSASVYRSDRGGWLLTDHGTGKTWNAHQFLTDVQGLSGAAASEEIRRRAGATITQKPPRTRSTNAKEQAGKVVERYDYVDEDGVLLYQVERLKPKSFRQRSPLPGGEWKYEKALEGVRRVLYQLPEVLAGIELDQIIHLVEGEKDVHSFGRIGLVATTAGMGAGKWEAGYTESLKGARLVILPDNDDEGRRHARKVAGEVHEAVSSLKIVQLPGLPEKGDVSDYLEAHTSEELQAVIDAAPVWDGKEDLTEYVNRQLGEVWGDILPLPDTMPATPSMPVKLLPGALSVWIVDAAEELSAPIEMIAVPAIVALSAVVGRRVGIHPKKEGRWLIVPNLWGCVVGRPSTGKSPAIDEALDPIRHLEKQARQAARDEEAKRKARLAVAKGELERLKRSTRTKMTTTEKAGLENEILEKQAEIEELERPISRRYVISDTTAEKAAILMRENPTGLLLHRDELIGWLKDMDRPGRESSRAFWLEAWKGTGRFVQTRVGRDDVDVDAVCFAVIGGIQPSRLQPYVQSVIAGETEDDGLLQRFQLLVWSDVLPEFKNVDRRPNLDAIEQVRIAYQYLDQVDPLTLGAEVNDYQADGVPALRFSDDAQLLWDQWYTLLMKEQRSTKNDRTPAYQAHVGKYPATVASLALLFHLLAVSQGENAGPVTKQALNLAINWCTYLARHAQKLYAPELLTDVIAAHDLLERIEAGQVRDGAAVRDVYRHQWAGLTTREAVLAAVRVLEGCNIVRLEQKRSGGRGRPTETIRINPELLE